MTRYCCPGCGYLYDEQQGNPHEGFPPGTPWSKVPDGWACPDCAVREKADFVRQDIGEGDDPRTA